MASYLSVRAVQPRSALDLDQRVQAVQAFCNLPEAEALTAANKCVSNLLSKFEAKRPETVEPRQLITGVVALENGSSGCC